MSQADKFLDFSLSHNIALDIKPIQRENQMIVEKTRFPRWGL